jgi:hypothetical protein
MNVEKLYIENYKLLQIFTQNIPPEEGLFITCTSNTHEQTRLKNDDKQKKLPAVTATFARGRTRGRWAPRRPQSGRRRHRIAAGPRAPRR